MPGSRSRRSRRSGGGFGTWSPAPVGGRRSRRRSRRGGYMLSPAPVGTMTLGANTNIPDGGVGAGFGQVMGGRSRRGGSLSPLTPALFAQEGGIGYNGINMPVGAGTATLSGGRRRRR
jgi:hypothetical protein